ncbi:CybS-domain-containing protein [Cladochytrium replicatum]|nr:CybS-domain-containing protein [Cladochytrium replicatum]
MGFYNVFLEGFCRIWISYCSLHTVPAALLHSTSQKQSDAAVSGAAAAIAHKSRTHGSYHWDLERGLSVISLPLMGAAFIVGPNALIDVSLGIVLPLHCHIGFDGIVVDYLHERKYGKPIYWTAKALVYGATGLTLYGLFQFNTNDIGITAFVKRLWTGKI